MSNQIAHDTRSTQSPADSPVLVPGHASARADYVTPTLRVHGDVNALTHRNWWAPGRQDGSNWFRRTG